MTELSNRFQDHVDMGPDVVRLRDLHAQMDRAVLDAYGWSDVPTACDFLLEHENDVEDVHDGSAARKKYRYRWPDDVRDEVLARLLEVNRQRAEKDGWPPSKRRRRPGKPRAKRKKPRSEGGPSVLF